MKKVIVIGGGASGLMAAYAAGTEGAEVLLLEKNEKLGKKIYITGKGRCNLTNDCAPDDFLRNAVRGEKFLRSAIWAFPPERTMAFMQSYGLSLKTERGNRVFPASDRASDVTKTLEKACRTAGVEIHLNEEVQKIDILHSNMFDIITNRAVYRSEAVVVATGGLSYPATGSTGDGYRFAREAGHTLVPCVPSLVGVELQDDVSSCAGISLKNAVLTARMGEKLIFSRMGEMLFTHYGVSGPLVLSLSAQINRLPLSALSLFLDFKPALSAAQLDARLVRDCSERKNESMKNVIRGLLPSGICALVLKTAAIAPEKQANSLTREERARLKDTLKAFPLFPRALRGFSEAVVTSGGVSLAEVSPKTMESKLVGGLYFCGEVLDADCYTGGFNMQTAFSTGFAAGRNAAQAG